MNQRLSQATSRSQSRPYQPKQQQALELGPQRRKHGGLPGRRCLRCCMRRSAQRTATNEFTVTQPMQLRPAWPRGLWIPSGHKNLSRPLTGPVSLLLQGYFEAGAAADGPDQPWGPTKRAWLSMARDRAYLIYALDRALVANIAKLDLPYTDRKVHTSQQTCVSWTAPLV